MKFARMLRRVEKYYSEKIRTHGATAAGVDWNSPESQDLRFEQLLKVCDTSNPFSLNDYGCGYGAIVHYLNTKGFTCNYRGFDISPLMIDQARTLHQGLDRCEFFNTESRLSPADYTVASGVFNVKMQASDDEWQNYILHTVGRMAELSTKGFAFNVLSLCSDPERRRPDLYYADPEFWFDYCKSDFSQFVALLHDYPLYEFTILVKRQSGISWQR